MRTLIACLTLSGVAWAGTCATPTVYTVGSGQTYATITLALAAVKTDCPYSSGNFTAAKTISIYNGTYTESGLNTTNNPSWNNILLPTATYPLTFSAAAGNSPIIDCGGGANDFIADYSPYVTFDHLEIKNCRRAVFTSQEFTGSPCGYATISNNYIHDMTSTGYYAIGNAGVTHCSRLKIHDNYLVNVVKGIVAGPYDDVEYNEVNTSTSADLISDDSLGGASAATIANNIAYYGANASTAGVLSIYATPITGNVTYHNRYGTETLAVSSPGPTFSGNIDVDNLYNCHDESAGGQAYFVRTHSFCYYATSGSELWVNPNNSGFIAGVVLENNLSWSNAAAQSFDYNVRVVSDASFLYEGNNAYNETGQTFRGLDMAKNSGYQYTSLATWQAGTGMDTTSLEANPRLVGDPNLLVAATGQVFTSCANIECRLGKIRRNYMPTNLALKGKGCAWNGSSCVADHSDIGAVPITIYDAPGITGGGAY